MERGEIPKGEEPQLFASYVAGLFRAMRFGVDEAHGHGAAIQYGYLRERKAIVWDAAVRRYRVDAVATRSGVLDPVADLVRLQGDGDYTAMKAFFTNNGRLDAEAQAVIATLGHIPVDIQPVYPDRI